LAFSGEAAVGISLPALSQIGEEETSTTPPAVRTKTRPCSDALAGNFTDERLHWGLGVVAARGLKLSMTVSQACTDYQVASIIFRGIDQGAERLVEFFGAFYQKCDSGL
jgi:hypothetical protein